MAARRSHHPGVGAGPRRQIAA